MDSEKNDGMDRLSELPDDILVHILSYLPTLDAVRTVLIRRFGDLWTLLPSLEFHYLKYLEAETRPPGLKRRYSRSDDYFPSFANFVRNVLFLHKKFPIHKFRLNLLDFSYVFDDADASKLYKDEVVAWLRFALDRQCAELILELRIDTKEFDDPFLLQPLFTSQFLVVLHLDSFWIGELSQVHMVSLRKLSLRRTFMRSEVLNKIILGCPSLQELALSSLIGWKNLRFTAPNIERLILVSYEGLLDCPNLKILDIVNQSGMPIQVVDVSSIREVNIGCSKLNVFDEYQRKFCNAELFKFSDEAFQKSKFKNQDLPQTRWKRLHIKSLLRGDQFSGICRILRSSPYLEELVVYKDPRVSGRKQEANMLCRDLPSCLMQQLKTVTISGYKVPCHSLLQLAEYLLANSLTLKKMVILPAGKNKSSAGNQLKFVKQLLSFPRASSNARVIFGSDVY